MSSRDRTLQGDPGKKRKARSAEPDLVMMLANPEVRLLMRVDRVDEKQLLRMLKGISVRLRREGRGARIGKGKRRASTPNTVRQYRRGVGIMLVNSSSQVFIARRNDVPGDAWQMPQGGIDRGETPRAAAYRELKEEIGTAEVDVIAESRDWLYYDLPQDVAKKAWGGRWKGQRQKWFLMLFKGTDADINVATSHAEFDTWRWASIQEIQSLAVSFKKRLYLSVLNQFAEILKATLGEGAKAGR